MNILLKLIALCILSINAYAYNDTNSYSRAHGEDLKKFTLEAVFSAEQTKDYTTGKHDGLYNQLDVAGTYSLTKKDDLRLYGSAVYHIYDGSSKLHEGKNAQFNWDLVEFMYRRNSILNSEDHGVSMDLELKNYYILESERRELYGFDGAFIPQLIFKKRFGRRFMTELQLRRHFYYKNNGKDSTLDSENRIYFTPTYVFTRKFFVSTLFRYKGKIRGDKYFSYRTFSEQPKVSEEVIMRPSLMYLVNHRLLVEGYWETKIAESHDGRAFVEDWQDKGVFGVSAYFTAF